MRVLSGGKAWKGRGDLGNPGQGTLGAENRKEQLLIPIREPVPPRQGQAEGRVDGRKQPSASLGVSLKVIIQSFLKKIESS